MSDVVRGEMLAESVYTWAQTLLGNNLVGVYFHGSMRLGGFNWDRSDADFIIVVLEKLSGDIKMRLWSEILSHEDEFPAKGFEFSVVLLKDCKDFKYPTPYELHGSRDWIGTFRNNSEKLINDDEKVDYDLASHFGVIRSRRALKLDFGAPTEAVFGPVPMADILDSNWRDIQDAELDIVKNPMYVTLNLCRFIALAKDGKILSKEEGAEWIDPSEIGVDEKIIGAALDEYRGGAAMDFSDSELIDFAVDMLDEARRYYDPETRDIDS